MEREEEGLLCSGAEKMPADGVEARRRGKRGGERRRRCDMAERDRGELSRRCGEMSFFAFFRTVGGRVDEMWSLGSVVVGYYRQRLSGRTPYT